MHQVQFRAGTKELVAAEAALTAWIVKLPGTRAGFSVSRHSPAASLVIKPGRASQGSILDKPSVLRSPLTQGSRAPDRRFSFDRPRSAVRLTIRVGHPHPDSCRLWPLPLAFDLPGKVACRLERGRAGDASFARE